MISAPSSASLQVAAVSEAPATAAPTREPTSPRNGGSPSKTKPTSNQHHHQPQDIVTSSHANPLPPTTDSSANVDANADAKNPASELALAHKFLTMIQNGTPLTHLAVVQDRAFRGGLILMLASPVPETVLLALQTLLLLAQSPDPRVFAPIRGELAFRTAMSHFLSEPGVDPKVREMAMALAKRPDPSASGLRVAVGGCVVSSPTKRGPGGACSPSSSSSSGASGLSTRCVAGWPTSPGGGGARTGSPRRMASVSRVVGGAGYASRAPSTARSIFTPTRSRALHIALLHPPTTMGTVSPRLHAAITRTLLATPGIISFTIESSTAAASPGPPRPRIVLRVVPTIQPDDLLQHLVRRIPAVVKEMQDREEEEGDGSEEAAALDEREASKGITLAVVVPARRADGVDTVLPAVRTPSEEEVQEEDEEESEDDDSVSSQDGAGEEENDPYAYATKRTEMNKRALDAPGYLDDNGVDPFAQEEDADDKDNAAKVVPKGWLGKVSSWLGW